MAQRAPDLARTSKASARYPSTTLRVVPLPTAFGGREELRLSPFDKVKSIG
jgi:hypothetical protein